MRNSRTRPRQPKPLTSPLTAAVKSRLHQEARHWKLTDDEYARLVLALTAALRRGIPAGTTIDAKRVLSLVDNPMFGVLVEYVVKMASQSSTAETQTDAQTGTAAEAGSGLPQVSSPGQPSPAIPDQIQRVAPMPPPGWGFW